MKANHAVLLMAYGGPGSLDDVEAYLLDVRGGRATPPELVEEIRERYALIGGRSPLLEITCRQATALEALLNGSDPGNFRVFVGMRHWHPYIREAVEQIARANISRVTALCLTPFASRMSTGAYYDQLLKAVDQHDPQCAWRTALEVHQVGAWYARPGFIEALAANLKEGLARFGPGQDPYVLFSAHSLPAALAEQGDPYATQFYQLSQSVARSVGLPDDGWQTCYQSAGAQNTRWLGPPLEETIHHLAAAGKSNLLVAPVGFLSDHVEILYDIDIEAQREAAAAGVHLERTVSLNDQPAFIQALADIVFAEEVIQ